MAKSKGPQALKHWLEFKGTYEEGLILVKRFGNDASRLALISNSKSTLTHQWLRQWIEELAEAFAPKQKTLNAIQEEEQALANDTFKRYCMKHAALCHLSASMQVGEHSPEAEDLVKDMAELRRQNERHWYHFDYAGAHGHLPIEQEEPKRAIITLEAFMKEYLNLRPLLTKQKALVKEYQAAGKEARAAHIQTKLDINTERMEQLNQMRKNYLITPIHG